jgi:hypothetical protein
MERLQSSSLGPLSADATSAVPTGLIDTALRMVTDLPYAAKSLRGLHGTVG